MAVISDLVKALKVTSAAMKAQDRRILVISQNLANSQSKASSPDVEPYRRKIISFSSRMDSKSGVELVGVKSIQYTTDELPTIYSPGDPGANDQGYVKMTNVNTFIELADLREASQSHEACLKGYEKALSMIQDIITSLKG